MVSNSVVRMQMLSVIDEAATWFFSWPCCAQQGIDRGRNRESREGLWGQQWPEVDLAVTKGLGVGIFFQIAQARWEDLKQAWSDRADKEAEHEWTEGSVTSRQSRRERSSIPNGALGGCVGRAGCMCVLRLNQGLFLSWNVGVRYSGHTTERQKTWHLSVWDFSQFCSLNLKRFIKTHVFLNSSGMDPPGGSHSSEALNHWVCAPEGIVGSWLLPLRSPFASWHWREKLCPATTSCLTFPKVMGQLCIGWSFWNWAKSNLFSLCVIQGTGLEWQEADWISKGDATAFGEQYLLLSITNAGLKATFPMLWNKACFQWVSKESVFT